MTERPVPQPDRVSAPFWDALAGGRFELQQCDSCARWVFYPRAICPHCGGVELTWRAASGRGVVYSFTVVHRAPEAFAAEAPYVVALVDLEEAGARIMTRVLDPPEAVTIGARLELSISGEPPLPTFRLSR